MLGVSLLLAAANIRLIQARASLSAIELVIATTTVGAPCPCCGHLSRRVHSRYVRHLQDAPLRRVQVSVELHVRKFHCDSPGCERSIFVERVAGFANSYARRTVQLDEVLELLAFVGGGEGGSRLAAEMRIQISPQTLIRLIRRHGVGAIIGGSVLGIDDWSFAKRKRYGSLIVDLEEHRIVDVLPDRLAQTVSAWLKDHPDVEIVSRDRGENFIRGITEGAPNATQVADRWHLHHNLGEMLKRVVEQHLSSLRALIAEQWRDNPAATQLRSEPQAQFYKAESADERAQRERDERYRLRYDTVHGLARQGKSGREIAVLTGLSRNTIKSILSAQTYPGVPQRGSQRSPLDPFKEHILRRVAQGCANAVVLFKEVAQLGFKGAYSTVWHFMRLVARQSGQLTSDTIQVAGRPSPITLPSAFEIIQWLMGKDVPLNSEQVDMLTRWVETNPSIVGACDFALRFTQILTERQVDALDMWIADALASNLAVLRQFAKGIQADHDAVLAALRLPWSNAQLEGQVNRLKLIKRQMYGRAKFDLLKIRVMTKL
jgi:transposase